MPDTQVPKSKLYIVTFCDPAGGKKKSETLKRQRARSAIVTVGMEPDLGRIFALQAWGARCTTDQLIDKIIEVNSAWRPRTFGVEANAMQSLFADALSREARMKGIRLPVLQVQQPARVDKDNRIRDALQPLLSQGRLFLHPDMHELIVEMRGFPTAQTKDIVDALASACALLPRRTAKAQSRADGEQLVRYLRDSGAPAWYIEQEEVNERRGRR